MTDEHSVADGDAGPALPDVRPIGIAELKAALAKGLDDFMAMPTHLLFLCMIYPIVIIVMARAFAGDRTMSLVFPLLAGYTLIGPLIATGMYELSRSREQGLDIAGRRRRMEPTVIRHLGRTWGDLHFLNEPYRGRQGWHGEGYRIGLAGKDSRHHGRAKQDETGIGTMTSASGRLSP